MEEISLKELIQVILKGRWIIAVFTAFCIIVSAFVSFFILPSQYEAATKLMISPLSLSADADINTENINYIVTAMAQYQKMTMDTYKEQIKANSVLEYVRKEAGLGDMSLKKIENKLEVNFVDKTNIITISATDEDPKKAAELANITARKFREFVAETNQKQAIKSAEYIKLEMDKVKENLDIIYEELKNQLAQTRGPDELKLELSSKLQQLTDFKARLVQLKIDREIVLASLTKTEEIMKNTSEYIELKKSLLTDDILSGVAKDKTGECTIEIAGISIRDQQINDSYIMLITKYNDLGVQKASLTAEKSNIQVEIQNLQKNIKSIQSELAEKQKIYDDLQHQYGLAMQAYEALQNECREATIKQSAKIGNQSIVIISEAVAPELPAAPNKKLNVAIAAVLGIMLSVFAVFMREYWISSDKQVKEI